MVEGNFEIERPARAENLNMACFAITRALEDLDFSVPEAAPLARHLLRIAGRIVIDTGAPGAEAEVWSNTESMALQWLREALKPIGYDVQPLPGSGRPPVEVPSEGWN
jgi:glyoxylase-like metal-dependent hydrolase (beta-lactamase superfamily II)